MREEEEEEAVRMYRMVLNSSRWRMVGKEIQDKVWGKGGVVKRYMLCCIISGGVDMRPALTMQAPQPVVHTLAPATECTVSVYVCK